MAVLKQAGQDLQQAKFDWLLRKARAWRARRTLWPEWIAHPQLGVRAESLARWRLRRAPADLEGSAKRWSEWMELERPEEEPMPGDWKKYPDFEQAAAVPRAATRSHVLALKHVRQERCSASYYVTSRRSTWRSRSRTRRLGRPFSSSSPPVLTSPPRWSRWGSSGYTSENGKVRGVSLGQGQEPIADEQPRPTSTRTAAGCCFRTST